MKKITIREAPVEYYNDVEGVINTKNINQCENIY